MKGYRGRSSKPRLSSRPDVNANRTRPQTRIDSTSAYEDEYNGDQAEKEELYFIRTSDPRLLRVLSTLFCAVTARLTTHAQGISQVLLLVVDKLARLLTQLSGSYPSQDSSGMVQQVPICM